MIIARRDRCYCGTRRKAEAKLLRELAKAERGISRSLQAILPGDGASSPRWTRLQMLVSGKARLEAGLASVDAVMPSVEFHPNVPELCRRRAVSFADLLTDEQTFSEAVVIVRALLSLIEVVP